MDDYQRACIKAALSGFGIWVLGRYLDGQWWTFPLGLSLGFLQVSALRSAARYGARA